ncbi:MAG: hypothetical protein RJA81_1572, partial [Planctomycetota bacterium]
MVKDNKPAVYDVGIDEAGYGPNLGPLVMTAIVARSEGPPPDLWKDMPAVEKVTKSDRTPQLLIDDSKRIMSQSQGMDWLEKVVQSLAATVNEGLSFQSPLDHWCSAFGPQLRQDNEMDLWVDSPAEMQVLQPKSSESNLLLKANSWAIYASRVVIAGPCRFNSLLGNPPNKASAHGIVFLEILRWLQSIAKPGDQFRIISDRHSGRKFYAPLLCQIFGDSWIEKISESQKQSSYRTEFENSLYDI